MANVTIPQNEIVAMHIDSTKDAESSENVLLELTQAWNYVKKWYSFRNRPDDSVVVFSKNKSNITKMEQNAAQTTFLDLPV